MKFQKTKKILSRVLPITTMVLAGGMLMQTQNVQAATTWGPERETFTWETPATFPTINSITDNPEVGDERNFVRVRKNDTTSEFSDNVTAEVGQQYEVYVYFHNNANTSLNASGAGIAQNVRLRMQFPEVIQNGEAAMVKGTISSTNTTPAEVWDTAYIHAPEDQTVYLRYVPNSAVIYSNGTINGQILSDSALYGDEGAKLGWKLEQWGLLPGCSEYAGYVKFLIQVDQPGFYMEKTAASDGSEYSQYITVAPGDEINFKIRYHNIGTTIQNDVTVFDELPDGMSLVGGSVRLKTPTTEGTEGDDGLFSGSGLIIGDYNADDEAYVTYTVKIDDDADLFPCGETIIYNKSAVATTNGTIHDKVQVKVRRQCVTEMPKAGPGEIALCVISVVMLAVMVTYIVMAMMHLKTEKSMQDQQGQQEL